MSTNYITSAPLVMSGAFLVVVSQAFDSRVLGWVAFGVAIGVVTIVLLAQLARQREAVQRVLDGAVAAVGGLLIAFALAGSGSTVIWLTFASGMGIAMLGFTGLTLHEISNWRRTLQLPHLRWLKETDQLSMPPQSRAA
jgi:hypothetical protein